LKAPYNYNLPNVFPHKENYNEKLL